MNQKGWGFKDFIVILGIIMASVLITFIIYKVSFRKTDSVTDPVEVEKNIYESYEEMEYILKKSAERYQNDNYQGNIDNDENWILSSSLLYKKGYLKQKLIDIEDKSKECEGYVRFIKKGASVGYIPYVKCGSNYVTEGYDANYIE